MAKRAQLVTQHLENISRKALQDYQLVRALDLLQGLSLFGGKVAN